MAFKSVGIDFKKLLWDNYRIMYGPKDSYCDYPRRYKSRGIRIDSYSNIQCIVNLEFIIITNSKGERWLHIEKGGVTGYESIRVNELDSKDWYACAGTKNKYDTLIVKSKDLKILLANIKE